MPAGPVQDLHAALAEVARAIAGALEVKHVWQRVADACRAVVAFDAMGIVCLQGEGRVRAVAAAGDPEFRRLEGVVLPRAGFSARLWPELDDFLVLIDDAAAQLDAAFPIDRKLIDGGMRSALRVPLGRGGGRRGSVLLMARAPSAFTARNGEQLALIAELAALALAHEELAARLAEESRRSAAAQAEAQRLEQRVQGLVDELEARSPHRALGRSKRWREVLAQATQVAATETTVLLTGESGTGKEVIARFVHRASPRRQGPFVALNCAALPEQLLESELFGHERGAFTGALAARAGRIEQAAGGVLFLDEVGEMSPLVQAKFLRVLQEREYQRLGGQRTLKAEVRVLAATNRDLKAMVARGLFREDLYYRLAVFDLALPALRERGEDIGLLVDAFAEELGRSLGRPAAGISSDARALLRRYAWPGNVRELRNVIERALILCGGGVLQPAHLPLSVAAAPAPVALNLRTMQDAERELIADALQRSGNNKSQAARLLGMTRAQLRSRLEKHGLAID